MLKKLLGLGKESGGFYLELDENDSGQETKASTAVAEKPAKSKKKVKAAAAIATPTPAPTPEPEAKVEAPAPEVPKTVAEAAPVAEPKVEPAVEPVVTAESPTNSAVNDKYRQAFGDSQSVELTREASKENLELVIRAAYKQVFGNAHLMDSEKSPILESELRNGEITVSEFVRKLAQSDRYRSLFFDKCPNATAVELNFKHLLGRAPKNYAEISQHIQILAEGGFAAEIDSYIDSEEYFQNFGEYTVPFYRGYDTQPATDLVSFTHSFQILQGACSSSKSTFEGATPKLQESLIQNGPSAIAVPREIPDSFPESLIMAPPKPPKTIPDVEELIANAVGIPYWGIPAVVPEKTAPVDETAPEKELAAVGSVAATPATATEQVVTEEETSPKKRRFSLRRSKKKQAAPEVVEATQPKPFFVDGNFATDYLIDKPAPNRRPGESLNKFREMTRAIKIRR